MSQEITRLYRGKDIDMLTDISTIVENAQANQATLVKKRTNLTTAYLEDLEVRINSIIKTNFGVDNAKQLRKQTQLVYSLQNPAYDALSEMKKQIGSSYSSDKVQLKEWLTSLGYNTFFKDAQKNDTEAIIALLYQYQQNLTPEQQQQLSDTGIPKEVVTAPLTYAQTLKDANVSQEAYKGTRKVSTAGVVQQYNDIYFEVISKISKLASVFFPGDKARQQLFSYTGILKAMNKQPGNNQPSAPPA